MLSELPNLDDEVSFVVDGGNSVGPIPMRDIIASVRTGQRDPSALVWWAGATDWIRFDVHHDLMALAGDIGGAPLQAVPEVFEPAAEVFDPTLVEPTQPELVADPAGATRWVLPNEAAEADVFTPEPVIHESPAYESAAADAVTPLESVPTPTPAAETFEPAAQTFEPAAQVIEPAAQTPQEQLAAEPVASPIAAAPVEQVADDDAFSFNLPVREASEVPEPDKKVTITGLFSSGARTDASDVAGVATPSPDALDAILAARTSLESVGARIEALSSATKRSLTPEEIQSGVDDFTETGAAPVALAEPVPIAEAIPEPEALGAGSWTAVEAETAVVAAPAGSSDQNAARALLTNRFKEMVAKSEEHQRRIEWVTRVDELLLSACITAIADSGFIAMDLSSRESDHRVLFEHNDDSRRVCLELSPVENVSEHLGRHVNFGLSWGRSVSRPDEAFAVVRQENPHDPVPPGVVTCEANIAEASVSTHVNLILAADDFVKQDYGVDRASLDSSIAAAIHALEERWHELFDWVS